MEWPRPSARTRELLRRGAEIVLSAPQEWLDELDAATLSATHMQAIAEDPVLAAATRRTNRANLAHWAKANVLDPGAPVSANVGAEALAGARDLVRRGLVDSALHAYRDGQNASWQRWMSIAFGLTSDPDELRELLDVSARSIAHFVDVSIAAIAEQMQREREALTRGTHAERREIVALILEGAPVTHRRAESRLGYRLDQTHTAAVVWSDEADCDLSDLERAADALARASTTHRPLAVVASAATIWVWLHAATMPDSDHLATAIADIPNARIAIGSTASGMEGFRRGHLDALTAQRMVARLHTMRRVVTFDAVHLSWLVTQNPEQADQFIRRTLGRFESAEPELRVALLTYIREQCNVSRAAATLYIHRNTLLRRLARAEALLPQPLATNSVQVAVALDALHWRSATH